MKRIFAALLLILVVSGVGWGVHSYNQLVARARTKQFNDDIDNLFYALQKYKERLGSYPTGDNAQVAQALQGNNSKNLIILVGRKKDINSKGELVDPWGTPFRIYFAGEGILIRSAGPNKRFDDSAVPDSDDYFRSN